MRIGPLYEIRNGKYRKITLEIERLDSYTSIRNILKSEYSRNVSDAKIFQLYKTGILKLVMNEDDVWIFDIANPEHKQYKRIISINEIMK